MRFEDNVAHSLTERRVRIVENLNKWIFKWGQLGRDVSLDVGGVAQLCIEHLLANAEPHSET